MIGTRIEAQAAFNTMHSQPTDIAMEYVGEGSYRTVYRGPSGIVYKVGCGDANYDEVSYSRRTATRKLLERNGILIPKFSIHRVARGNVPSRWLGPKSTYVSATEYIDIDHSRRFYCESYLGLECLCVGECYNDRARELYRLSGLDDLHSENVVWDTDGRLWILDLAL